MLALKKGNNPSVRMETTIAYHKLGVRMSQHQPVFDTNRTYLALTSRNHNKISGLISWMVYMYVRWRVDGGCGGSENLNGGNETKDKS